MGDLIAAILENATCYNTEEQRAEYRCLRFQKSGHSKGSQGQLLWAAEVEWKQRSSELRKIWDNESGEWHGHSQGHGHPQESRGLERGVLKAERSNSIIKAFLSFCLLLLGGEKSSLWGENFSFIWKKTFAVGLLFVQRY